MTATAYIGLGANLGDRAAAIDAAVAALAAAPEVAVTGLSGLRETDPVGYLDQPAFLNAVARVETSLAPAELLALLLRIERDLGRRRTGPRFGPRAIDLDLLVFGDVQVVETGLEVPHPRLPDRRFALEPLLDLDPELAIPGRGRVADLVLRAADAPGRLVRPPAASCAPAGPTAA